MGDYEKAMKYFQHDLDVTSAVRDRIAEGKTYAQMGNVLLLQDGREKEAIEMLQKPYEILETCVTHKE